MNKQLLRYERPPLNPIAHCFDRYGLDPIHYTPTPGALSQQWIADSVGKQTRPVQVGRAYRFNTAGYVTLGDANGYLSGLPTSYIINFYFTRPNTTGNEQMLFCLNHNANGTGQTGSTNGIGVMYWFGTSNQFTILAGSAQGIAVTIALTANQVYKCTLVFQLTGSSVGTYTVYIDDGLRATATSVPGGFFDTNSVSCFSALGASYIPSNPLQKQNAGLMWGFQIAPYSAGNLTAIQANGNKMMAGAKLFLKCDEQAGTICYDSSGNGNHGTIVGATLPAFHAVQTGAISLYSYQNEGGYNLPASTYIPRNEANPRLDVLGNALTFSGRVKYNALLKQSHCITFTTTQYLHLGNKNAFVPAGGFIVSFFMRRTANARMTPFHLQGNGATPTNGPRITIDPNAAGDYIFDWKVNSGLSVQTLWQTVLNQWYHVVCYATSALSSGSYGLYVDGLLIGTLTGGFEMGTIADAVSSVIGGIYIAGAPVGRMTGQVANLQYASYSAGNLTKALAREVMDSMIFHFPLAEGAGSYAYDASGNNHHTLITNPTGANWTTKQDYTHHNLLHGFTKLISLNNFEDGVNDWTYFPQASPAAVSVSVVADPAGTQGNVIRFVRNSTSVLKVGIMLNRASTPGANYKYSFKAKAFYPDAKAQAYMRVGSGAADPTNNGAGLFIPHNGAWVTYSGTIRAVGSTGFYIVSSNEASTVTAVNDTFWLDDLQIEIDGSMPGKPNTGKDFGNNPLVNPPVVRGHSGAETVVDFTGGVQSPAAVLSLLPSAYDYTNFGLAVGKSKGSGHSEFLFYRPTTLTPAAGNRVANFQNYSPKQHPGLKVWMDGADEGSFTYRGDTTINTVKNKKNNVAMTTSNFGLVRIANGIVMSETAASYIALDADYDLTTSNFSLFAVTKQLAKTIGATSGQTGFIFGSPATVNCQFRFDPNGTVYVYRNGTQISSSVNMSNASRPQFVEVHKNGTSYTYYQNGVLLSTVVNASSAPFVLATIGSLFSSNAQSNLGNSTFYELLLCSTFDIKENSRIRRYLYHKWGTIYNL